MPMVIMPKMGDAMEEGVLLRWLKQEGDEVAAGEPIAEIETDKVNLEIESAEAGIVRRFLVEEGQPVPVGAPIAIVGDEDEPVEVERQTEQVAATAQPLSDQAESEAPGNLAPNQGREGAGSGAEVAPQPQPVNAQARGGRPPSEPAPPRAPGERVRATPLVRRLAAEHDIDLGSIRGSGPGGRIIKDDVMPLIGRPRPEPAAEPAEEPVAPPEAEPAPAPAFVTNGAVESELRDLSRIRRTIAKRMSDSFQQAPHFYVSVSIDMSAAMELRKQINAQVDERQRVSVNDLIVKAAALALRQFPMLNASFAGEQVRLHKRIDVAIAVALEAGLISPFIPDADNKPLGAIAAMSKDLVERARGGGLKPEEYQGGTFTISNLGMFGVDEFLAIINPPQAGILAVGTAKMEPVWNAETEEFEPKPMMKVTMSADHRVTDGAEVARYLAEVKRLLETPMLLLVS